MPVPANVKILFVGDMHLGRNVSHVPSAAAELGSFRIGDLSPVAAWRRVVEAAIAHNVHTVALAGDLVHRDDDLFEARAHLEDGITKLNAAGISVVAVSGNHDTLVLPLLAASIDGLHLLGPDGTWGTYTVADGVRLAGWSFPSPHHTSSPLKTPVPPAIPGVVTLGLLHADLDQSSSDYAPVSTGALLATGYQGWALGHIHAPDIPPGATEPTRPFYLGSTSSCNPTETGAHGPVLATVSAAGAVQWERLVLAPMRWKHLSIDLTALPRNDDLRGLSADLRGHLLQRVQLEDGGPALAVGLRVTLTGTHLQAGALQHIATTLAPEDLVTLNDRCVIFIQKITTDVTVPMDLPTLARQTDLPGIVAREILALESDEPSDAELLRQARAALTTIPGPADLQQPEFPDADLRRSLSRAGRQTLNALLAQNKAQTP